MRRIALILCFGPLLACAQASPWRYDLRPGDHLVYSETIERRVDGDHTHSRSLLRFTSHVVIAEAPGGAVTIAMQRQRDSADLLEYKENGKDRLAEQQTNWKQRVAASPAVISEANQLTLSGEPLFSWTQVRESSSRLLTAIHEFEALPNKTVKTGDSWSGSAGIRFRFRLLSDEDSGGERCASVRGESEGNSTLRYTYCPQSGLLVRIELEGSYGVFSGTVHDRIVFEFQRRTRGESLDTWLGNESTRQAALRALLRSPSLALPAKLSATLASLDPDSQILALALFYRRGTAISRELVAPLLESGDVRVRRLASLAAKPAPASPSADDSPPATIPRAVRSGKFAGAVYLLRVPEAYRRGDSLCAMVYLSGGAGLAPDAVATAEASAARWGCFMIYPHAAGRMWWEPEVAAEVAAVLDDAAADFHFDPARLLLAGFSNGASGALYFATHYPRRFGAILSLMGAGGCMGTANGWDFRALNGIPVLLVHGDKDDVVPRRCSDTAQKALTKAGAKVEFHILPGRGHDITLATDDGLSDDFVTRFIASQAAPH